MARSAKIYKRNTQQKRKQKPAKIAQPRVLNIESSEERNQKITFNHRVREAYREDLLDRL